MFFEGEVSINGDKEGYQKYLDSLNIYLGVPPKLNLFVGNTSLTWWVAWVWYTFHSGSYVVSYIDIDISYL